jgi:hypothetical protein
MKRLVFTFFLFFFLFSISQIVFADFSIGVQPSTIELNINPKYDKITLPYRLWNQGSDTITVTINPVNISEFTNFTTVNITLSAHTNRTNGYITLPIIFRMTSENKTVEGGIKIRPIPPETGMVKIIPEVFARIKIIQTDVNTGKPAYSFPTNSTPNVIPSVPSQNFFTNKTMDISLVIILAIVALAIWKFLS